MSNVNGRRAVRDNSTGERNLDENSTNPPIQEHTLANRDAGQGQILQLTNDILIHAEEAAYQWDVASDDIIWGADANRVLRLPEAFSIKTHADLLRHIGRTSARDRINIIKEATDAAEQPTTYAITYQFFPDPWQHDKYHWIEERGFTQIEETTGGLIARGVMRIVTDHKDELETLRYWATRDEVTRQLNRPQLIREIESAILSCQKNKHTSVFLLAGVENLAFINESYGYEVGDEVLAVVGQRFATTLRQKDCIGRHSANKFGILLHECGPEAMQHVANRLLHITGNTPVALADTNVNITLAIGGVLIPDQASDVQETISAAHEALDYARNGHQNKFAPYQPNPARNKTRAHCKIMADEIMAAMEDNRMLLALQPIVAAETGEPAFHECLIRMKRKSGELVSALEIIPIVEKLGLTSHLDHCVMRMAINLLETHPQSTLSINVSGQTTSDHEWLIALHKLTQGRRDIRQRLIVEITETSAVRDLDETVNFVDTLQDMGCRVAIDDFGSGYTSFQNLRYFGVDMVKIDGAFVSNITSDPHNQMFVETLIDLAQKFGVETVVEWVVDEEVANLMRKAGADYLQGSKFGMPSLTQLPTERYTDIGANI